MELTPRLAGISSDSLINKKTAHTRTNTKLVGKKKKKKKKTHGVMTHTQDTYIQQESVSAYIPHSNNAKTNFPQTTNKQPPHRIENKGSGEKIPERR
jgi:hypothetical protein